MFSWVITSAILLLTLHGCFASLVSLPAQLTFLLPYPFNGSESFSSAFLGNGTTSEGFVDTFVADKKTNKIFSRAKNAPFVSYSSEFNTLLGPNPQLKLISQRSKPFAAEGGAWDSENNEVWFISSSSAIPTYTSVLDLKDGTVRTPEFLGRPIVNANGAFYVNGSIYIATFGNKTYPAGVVRVKTASKNVSDVVNSYLGERFNGPDDLAWITKAGKPHLYFTDPTYAHVHVPDVAEYLPNTVYRFSPQDEALVPAIGRADVEQPNGIRTNPSQNILYVTDAPSGARPGVSRGKGTPAIYAFDIMKDGTLINKRLVGQPRVGVADGIKIDKKGRIWTGEGEGIVVRAPSGKILGLFNSQGILDPTQESPIANFALAGRTLVILAQNRLYTVELTEDVGTPSS